MRVLGLDPGSRRTGYGAVEAASGQRLRALAHGVIRLPLGASFETRIGALFEAACSILDRIRPDLAAIEDVFVAGNAKSALKLGQARGALLAACASRRVPVVAYPPSVIKQAVVGAGGAEKRQVQWMVCRLLGLREEPAEDAADALAAAICGLHHRRVEKRA